MVRSAKSNVLKPAVLAVTDVNPAAVSRAKNDLPVNRWAFRKKEKHSTQCKQYCGGNNYNFRIERKHTHGHTQLFLLYAGKESMLKVTYKIEHYIVTQTAYYDKVHNYPLESIGRL